MRRFELISLSGLAAMRRRAGAHDEALAMARQGWSMCTEIRAEAFAGPLVLIEIASNTPDAAESERLISQAEVLLTAGAVAHNQLYGYPDLMHMRLEQRRFDEVLRLADALEAFVRDEPNLWATHHARSARALVCAASGACDDTLQAELRELLAQAHACQWMVSAQALAGALQRIA